MMLFRLAGAWSLLVTAACSAWRPYESHPKLQPDQSLPHHMRAVRSDSSRLELTDPFVRADSLYGRASEKMVALPLSDVARLERSSISGWRTAALVGVPVVGLGLVYLVACGGGQCDPDYLQPDALIQ